jgi:hypothetical protein
MLRALLTCLMSVASFESAMANEAYLDDRSTAPALVHSLYNAINRGEYARAWGYFIEPPALSIEKYAAGYADTERVRLQTGSVSEEGAMGSSYYELPIAIEATSRDGSVAVFSGCYTLRRGNLHTEAEFQPLRIVSGSLKRSNSPLEDALPRRCGDGDELPAHDESAEKAKRIYASLERCDIADRDGSEPEELEPEVQTIEFNYAYDLEDAPRQTVTIYRFLCSRGAYNESYVFFMKNDIGEVSPLHFAQPELDIRYADEENEKVESITVTGFSAHMELVNAGYDTETQSLRSYSKWRGLGDASSSGTWEFREGQFRLVSFEVDASYDGEMNPETVVEYSAP